MPVEIPKTASFEYREGDTVELEVVDTETCQTIGTAKFTWEELQAYKALLEEKALAGEKR
jgi:hypothetical protein